MEREIFTRSTPDEPVVLEQKKRDGGEQQPSQSKIPVPLSMYESANETPYTAKFFNFKNYSEFSDSTDTHNIREGVSKIESFVFKQIEKRNLEDNTESYEQIMEELFEKIGVEKNEVSLSKFLKTVKYINLLGRNKTVDDRRRELLQRAKKAKEEYETRKQKMVEQNLERKKTETKELREKNALMRDRISKQEEIAERAVREAETSRLKLERLIEKNKTRKETDEQLKLNLYKENRGLQKELERVKKQEEVLRLKHKKLKELI